MNGLIESKTAAFQYIFAATLVVAMVVLVIAGYGADNTVNTLKDLAIIVVSYLFGAAAGRTVQHQAANDITEIVKQNGNGEAH